MSEFEIVQMSTEKEMDEKGYVHWKSWHQTYANLMPAEYLKNATLDRCVKMAHKFPDNTLLMKIDDKVVGFSCFGDSKDCESANELIALYLLEEYQGKKLGYALLNATFEKMSPKSKTILWVLKGNDKAINFYKRYGFVFNGKEKASPFGIELQMEMKK